MTDYKEVLSRADIQLFRSLLLCGVGEPGEQDHRPYEQRIREDERPIYKLLEHTFRDEKELDEAADRLNLAITSNQDVALEVGIKAGARFMLQLLFD